MANKHLVCRVIQVHENRYKLYCRNGILSDNFSSSDLKTCPKKHDIPLHKWRQSHVVSVRDIPNEDLDKCLCTAQHSTMDYVYVDDDGMEQADVWVRNPLYTLSNKDRETISQPNGWLRDSVINASQLLLLQDHPNIAGLQPPSLQQLRAFKAHSDKFVQIINVDNVHWCVVSNIGCQDGTVNVYDTLYQSLDLPPFPLLLASSLLLSQNSQYR